MNKKTILTLTLFFICGLLTVKAQLESERVPNKIINTDDQSVPSPSVDKGSVLIMAQWFGPEVIGLYGNYYLFQNFSINGGFGCWSNAHIGVNYYLMREGYARLYFGAQFYRILHGNLEDVLEFQHEAQGGFYIPIGLEINTKNGLFISLEAGGNIVEADYNYLNTKQFVFAIRIGGLL